MIFDSFMHESLRVVSDKIIFDPFCSFIEGSGMRKPIRCILMYYARCVDLLQRSGMSIVYPIRNLEGHQRYRVGSVSKTIKRRGQLSAHRLIINIVEFIDTRFGLTTKITCSIKKQPDKILSTGRIFFFLRISPKKH